MTETTVLSDTPRAQREEPENEDRTQRNAARAEAVAAVAGAHGMRSRELYQAVLAARG